MCDLEPFYKIRSQMMIIDTLIGTNGLTIINVGADNICLVMIINFVQNIYWQC